MKILMVCLGNICRSPLADGLLRKKIEEHRLNAEVDSAGTGSWHVGQAPDKRMIATASEYQLDISDLKARQFKKNDFDTFDLIFVMDHSNFKNVSKLSRNLNDKEKIKLILNEIDPHADAEVPDPYFGGKQGFHHVYALLDQATDKIVEKYLS